MPLCFRVPPLPFFQRSSRPKGRDLLFGRFLKRAGDRILSVFDRAENNASPEPIREAITAALWMQTIFQRVVAPGLRNLGVIEDVSAAMGIDYGPVVAGCVGVRNNKHFEFFGDAANNAAKLQEAGTGGEIVMSSFAYLFRPSFLNNGTWYAIDEGNRVRLTQRFADEVINPPKP
jgi:class 3 adenylate cyclase